MLAYVDAIVREDTITVDGYTSNKTERGIIKDVARAIEKYDQGESNFLLEMLKMTRLNIKKDITTIFVLDLYDKQTKINDNTWQNKNQVLSYNYKQTQLKNKRRYLKWCSGKVIKVIQ